jgi:hypothetical protein
MTGRWPVNEIDHINLVADDNRFCNLREATRSQNMSNMPKRSINTSGFKGAFWNKKNEKWISQIALNNKSIYLGCFDTAQEAHAAYCKAAVELQKEFARTA